MIGIISDFLQMLRNRNDNNNKDIIFFMNINGGYECWIQLELANFLVNKKYLNSTYREVNSILEINLSIGKSKRIDIATKIQNTYYLVELKCQSFYQSLDKIGLGFWRDFLKLHSIKSNDGIKKYAIAFCVINQYINNEYIVNVFNCVKQRFIDSGDSKASYYNTGSRLSDEEINLLCNTEINNNNICCINFKESTDYCSGIAAVVMCIQ